MRNFFLVRYLLACILLAFVTACASQEAAKPQEATEKKPEVVKGFYIGPGQVDLAKLLPKPSPDKSPISRGEGDLMIAMQAEASPAAKARAKSEESLTPWVFADVLGPDFNRQHYPLTAEILDKIEKDTHAATEKAKELWDRTRPPRQDIRITPFVVVPTNASYPSGHATRAVVWARILGALSPKQKDALRGRARLVAFDRVIAGVHYPTDVAAGMALGDEIADKFLASPALQADLEKAKAEWK